MTHRPNDRWSDEMKKTMIRLAQSGWTAKEIGAEIGVSRAAVIGQANRMHVGLTGIRSHQIDFDDPPPPVIEEIEVVPPRALRPDPEHPNQCATEDCRNTKQTNNFGLCASCNWERLKKIPRLNASYEISVGTPNHGARG